MASRQSLIGNFADESGVSRQPFAYLSIDRGDSESRKVRAIIDTGAEMIILQKAYALKMLGISEAQLTASELKLDMIVPGSDERKRIYGWKTNLRLRASGEDEDFLLIPDAIVYVRDSVFPNFPSLFGQFTGIQERFFSHHNKARNGFWQLMAS